MRHGGIFRIRPPKVETKGCLGWLLLGVLIGLLYVVCH
jgi:hypothetical protein